MFSVWVTVYTLSKTEQSESLEEDAAEFNDYWNSVQFQYNIIQNNIWDDCWLEVTSWGSVRINSSESVGWSLLGEG